MELIYCHECAWLAPLEDYQEAAERHYVMVEALRDILPSRDSKCGVCRKVTYDKSRPVLTRDDGYCHRAERK